MLFFALKTEMNNKNSVRFDFSTKNYLFWSILNNTFILNYIYGESLETWSCCQSYYTLLQSIEVLMKIFTQCLLSS